jgi:nicotinate-nucleotide adenylyltransferase
MTARPRVGVLGGTFDPIHVGHLAAAHAAERALDLDIVRLIPSARPPHRTDSPQASGYHRLEMIRRAVIDTASPGTSARWEVSDLELRREGKSYTVDTLTALHREGFAASQIFFIIGADAFAEIASWHRYPDALNAANFAVVARPGTTLEGLRDRLPWLAARMIRSSALDDTATTRVVLIESETPAVSSTDIRSRARRGESLNGFVTPAVAAYIVQNSLYKGSQE